jgi:hypothetical protein
MCKRTINTTSKEQLLELLMLGTSCFSEQCALALKSEVWIQSLYSAQRACSAHTITDEDVQCQQGVCEYGSVYNNLTMLVAAVNGISIEYRGSFLARCIYVLHVAYAERERSAHTHRRWHWHIVNIKDKTRLVLQSEVSLPWWYICKLAAVKVLISHIASNFKKQGS